MHIKSVAIEAFLSYEKLMMSSNMQLSPGCNLILGKNGSGKSNFLQGKRSNTMTFDVYFKLPFFSRHFRAQR